MNKPIGVTTEGIGDENELRRSDRTKAQSEKIIAM